MNEEVINQLLTVDSLIVSVPVMVCAAALSNRRVASPAFTRFTTSVPLLAMMDEIAIVFWFCQMYIVSAVPFAVPPAVRMPPEMVVALLSFLRIPPEAMLSVLPAVCVRLKAPELNFKELIVEVVTPVAVPVIATVALVAGAVHAPVRAV